MANTLSKTKIHKLTRVKGGKWLVDKDAIRKWANQQEDGNYGLLIYPVENTSLSRLQDLIFEIQTEKKKKGQGDLFGENK